MHSVTSNAVAQAIIGLATTTNINNRTGHGATIKNRPGEKILSINAYDVNNTGISIDFDYNSGQIRIYYVLNGVTQDMKYVNLS